MNQSHTPGMQTWYQPGMRGGQIGMVNTTRYSV